jgi:hypothetical protein
MTIGNRRENFRGSHGIENVGHGISQAHPTQFLILPTKNADL